MHKISFKKQKTEFNYLFPFIFYDFLFYFLPKWRFLRKRELNTGNRDLIVSSQPELAGEWFIYQNEQKNVNFTLKSDAMLGKFTFSSIKAAKWAKMDVNCTLWYQLDWRTAFVGHIICYCLGNCASKQSSFSLEKERNNYIDPWSEENKFLVVSSWKG